MKERVNGKEIGVNGKEIGIGFLIGFCLMGLVSVAFINGSNKIYEKQIDDQEKQIIKLEKSINTQEKEDVQNNEIENN